jgi:putative glycosyltransferase (TIGR04372 family)
MKLVEYITGRLGGQVVRIGHPDMTPFPSRPGFIDLALLENNFMLHAHAVARARFLVGSLTGTSHLGSALNTPTRITNCVEPPFFQSCWRDHDTALFAKLYDRDGRRVLNAEQWEKKTVGVPALLTLVKEHGYVMA